VCVSVRQHISRTPFQFFVHVIPMVVALSSSVDVAIRYVLPVFMDDVTFVHNGSHEDRSIASVYNAAATSSCAG